MESFALSKRRESPQLYLALCLLFNLFIHQVDIMGVYIDSLLEDNKLSIFMKLLSKMYHLYQIWKNLLYRLLKSLFCLRQSGRLWNQNIIVLFQNIGFVQLNKDLGIFIRTIFRRWNQYSKYICKWLLFSIKYHSYLQSIENITFEEI